MNTLEAIRIALQSLWANKLRSALTLLGVVIGVAAVIAVVTFVNGINGYVAEKIFNLGADVFIINKSKNVITNVDEYLEGRRRKDITLDDYQAVRDACRACTVIGATAGNHTGRVNYKERSITDSFVRGWTPSMARIYDLDIIAGRGISDADMNSATNVAVIGYDILEQVMGSEDPIGKEIRVDGQLYQVIGVGKKEGKTLGQSRDNWVMMPITSWLRLYGSHNSLRIWGKASAVGAPMDAAIDEARVVLRARRHDPPGQPDTFEAETNQTFLGIWASLSSSFFIVMVAIASISLVVGGIVIMNIMLVSVTERTREIGVRKAMGARKRDILLQFTLEAVTLTALGGLLGVLLGAALTYLVRVIWSSLPARMSVFWTMTGFWIACATGLVFGIYPAWKASNLDPIEALRYE